MYMCVCVKRTIEVAVAAAGCVLVRGRERLQRSERGIRRHGQARADVSGCSPACNWPKGRELFLKRPASSRVCG